MPQTDNLQQKLNIFEQSCRDSGLKLTHQRIEIYRELLAATDHPSAEMLYQRLRKKLPTISLDTVYRTLATFEDNRLISRIQTAESQARFEAKTEQHHHAICSSCGRISDFHWDLLESAQLPEELSSWGKIENKQITLRGTCRQCSGKTETK